VERTPVPVRHGDRNFFCPFYHKCLDVAVEKDWPGFTCRKCGYRDQGVQADPDPLFSVVSLCWAVLWPRKWSRFVATAERFIRRDHSIDEFREKPGKSPK
jgi:hypothetical protein